MSRIRTGSANKHDAQLNPKLLYASMPHRARRAIERRLNSMLCASGASVLSPASGVSSSTGSSGKGSKGKSVRKKSRGGDSKRQSSGPSRSVSSSNANNGGPVFSNTTRRYIGRAAHRLATQTPAQQAAAVKAAEAKRDAEDQTSPEGVGGGRKKGKGSRKGGRKVRGKHRRGSGRKSKKKAKSKSSTSPRSREETSKVDCVTSTVTKARIMPRDGRDETAGAMSAPAAMAVPPSSELEFQGEFDYRSAAGAGGGGSRGGNGSGSGGVSRSRRVAAFLAAHPPGKEATSPVVGPHGWVETDRGGGVADTDPNSAAAWVLNHHKNKLRTHGGGNGNSNTGGGGGNGNGHGNNGGAIRSQHHFRHSSRRIMDASPPPSGHVASSSLLTQQRPYSSSGASDGNEGAVGRFSKQSPYYSSAVGSAAAAAAGRRRAQQQAEREHGRGAALRRGSAPTMVSGAGRFLPNLGAHSPLPVAERENRWGLAFSPIRAAHLQGKHLESAGAALALGGGGADGE